MSEETKKKIYSIISIVLFFIAVYSLYEIVKGFWLVGSQKVCLIAEPNNTTYKKLAYISGAVNTPGVYEIREDARILDLVQLAGGFDSEVDVEKINKSINLAKRVYNEDQIFIPFYEEGSVSSTNNSSNISSNGGLVNINSANTTELESLPGVGPKTAEKIISNRPYSDKKDILAVPGIGDSTYNEIKDLISVD